MSVGVGDCVVLGLGVCGDRVYPALVVIVFVLFVNGYRVAELRAGAPEGVPRPGIVFRCWFDFLVCAGAVPGC